MFVLLLIPPVISGILAAAHFLRMGETGAVVACLACAALLFSRRAWMRTAGPLLLLASALLWVKVGTEMVSLRMAMGVPWLRVAIILGGVALFTAASSLVFISSRVKSWLNNGEQHRHSSAAAFVITAALLTTVNLVHSHPLLLLERFWTGGGWFEVFILSTYAAWVTGRMHNPTSSPRWRLGIWLAFSVVFFSQLLLGLLVSDRFLMTGELHLPVPAMIVAGPLYRGEGLFMPILFASTLLFVGPAWCSHLCYIGALDQLTSRNRRRPAQLPRWTRVARMALLLLVPGAALLLRFVGAPTTLAIVAGLAFGVIGLGVIFLVSRRSGVMVHCTVWCPIGLLAGFFGKLSPFRISFNDSCDDCGACTSACRFDALGPSDIQRRKPALTCSLCGDCIGKCSKSSLEYRFAGKAFPWARPAFITVVVALHAVCMGVARI